MLDIETIDTAAKAVSALNQLKIKDKHLHFARIYYESKCSAYEAYRQVRLMEGARCAESTAKTQAYSWLRIPEVKAYLKLRKLREDLERRTESGDVDPQRVLLEESHLAFLDPAGVVDQKGDFIRNLSEIPERTRRAISSIKAKQKWEPNARNESGENTGAYVWDVEYKFWDKGSALGRLEKALGMVSDETKVKVKLSLVEILQLIDGSNRGKLPSEQEEPE